MAFSFNVADRNAALTALIAQYPAGSIVDLRSGAAPAVGAAATGTVIASVTLPASPWGAVSNGSVPLAGVWQDLTADATGILGHFRLRTSGDANGASTTLPRVQGSIGLVGSGADMEVDNTNVVAGQRIDVGTFLLTA